METEAILQIFSIIMWLFYLFTYSADVFDIWPRIMIGAVSTVLWMVSGYVVNFMDQSIGFILMYLYWGFSMVTAVLIISDTHRVFTKHMDWWS